MAAFRSRLKAKGSDQIQNKIGARALRVQLGRVLEMADSSPDSEVYERKIVESSVVRKNFSL
jgi:hypothetical protein